MATDSDSLNCLHFSGISVDLKGGTNQSVASVCAVSENFEVNKNELVIDSGSTDHIYCS